MARSSSLASALRTLRRRAGVTQEQLAERSGLSVRTIRYLESGRVAAPHGDTVRLLADALDLTAEERRRLDEARQPNDEESPSVNGRVPGANPTPHQLPAAVPGFVGRGKAEHEIRSLLTATAPNSLGEGSAAVAVVLTGGPGIGKTALATRIGHLVSEVFTDGQLFVDLGGSATRHRDPAEVLGEMLQALGCDPSAVPEDKSARASLYRSFLAHRRVLVVLDDAADERQVRPLMPGSASSNVILTSRKLLAGLDGSHIVEIDVLADEDAQVLLSAIVGDRLQAEHEAASAIVRFCAGLPLALRICGALLRAHPYRGIAELAAELADEQRRLSVLTYSDLEVRASIGLSDAALSDDQRAAFAILGTLPVSDFEVSAAAAALNVPIADARVLLDGLIDAHLIEVHGTAPTMRFRFHDLVRLYTHDLALARGDRRAALIRLVGLWLTLAERADEALPGTSDIGTRGVAPRYPAETAVVERVSAAPVEWFATERRSIVQVVEAAAADGLSEQAWELAASLRTFAALKSEWDLWRKTHQVALRACSAAGNTKGIASMLLGLGKLRIDSHAVSGGAPAELRSAVELFHQIGDAVGEAQGLFELSSFLELTNDLPGSVEHAERAAQLATSAQMDDLAADAYYVCGRASRKKGDIDRAAPLLNRALDHYRRRGKPRGEAQVRWELAALHRQLGELGQAEQLLRSCTDGLRIIGDRRGLIRVLIDLAVTVSHAGRDGEALIHLAEAVDICHDLGERSFLARAADALADLLLKNGHPAEAAEHAGVAEEIWTALEDDVRAEASRQRRTAAERATAVPPSGSQRGGDMPAARHRSDREAV